MDTVRILNIRKTLGECPGLCLNILCISYAPSPGDFHINILAVYILANLNHSDNRGMKPIHYAAQYDSLKGLKKLIDCGANPDEKDLYEESPLFIAAKYGMFSLCYQ